MSLQVEKLEGNMAKLTIEVSAEDFEKAVEAAYHKNKGKISVPGFRKGKVPRKMIEQMYGKEVFFEDAANDLIPVEYEKAYDECEEEIVSQPKIDVVQLEVGKSFIFTAEVALKPEVVLGVYKGVTVEEPTVEVTEAELTEALEKERKAQARKVNVTDRAVQDKDETVIDFEGFVDGVAFEGGKGENYPLTIGSGAFIPGFEEQLIGANLNEEKEINVTFPEDYQAEELKGKAAIFKCTVKEIKTEELDELNDEFASEVSEFDTLEEYKADLKKNLEEKKAADAKNAKEEAVVEAVVANAAMVVPDAMIATTQRQMVQDFAQRLQSQGLSMEQYMKFTGMDEKTMFDQTKPQAEKRIKTRLALEAVAVAENIEVSDDEFEEELTTLAEMYDMTVDKIKEIMDEEQNKQMKKDIAVRKAVDFVVSQSKTK